MIKTLLKLRFLIGVYCRGLPGDSIHRRIIKTGITISVLTFICQLVALIKELWVAAWFGTSDTLDAFLIAMVIPTFVINVIAGSFYSAFIPEYIRVRDEVNPKEAQNLFSTILAYSLILLLMTSAIVALFAHLLLPMMASGFSTKKLALTQTFLYWLLPLITLQGVIVLWSAVLNASNKFGLASIVPVFLPLATIGTLVTTGRQWNAFSLVIGTLVGVIAQVITIGWRLKEQGIQIWPEWGISNPHARAVMSQYVYLVASSFLMSCTSVVDQSMAASLDPGSVAALNYGSRIVNVGLGLTAASFATATFPYFSKQVAQKNWTALWETLRFYLGWVFTITVPISFLISMFSSEIVRLFYERGAFLEKDTYIVAHIQSFFVWQVPFYIGGMLLVKVITSLQANHILMWASGVNLLLKFTMNYLFIQWIGVSGIALSTSLMYFGSFVFVYCFVWVLLGRLKKESQIYESK